MTGPTGRACLLFTLLPLAACTAPAANDAGGHPPPPTVSAMADSLQVHPVFHASLVLEYGNTVIYVDPYDGASRFAQYPAPDLVLITDIHPDHLDSATLGHLPLEGARIVAPQAVFDKLPPALQQRCTVLANGDSATVAGTGITALPMYNLPPSAEAPHTKGRGNGYVLTLGGKRVYISGDTQGIPEMRALRGIDIAFVCMNLPWTMDVDEAADAVLAFKPKVVYPYHYRGNAGFSDVARFKALVQAKDPAIEVRQLDWYPAQ